MSPQTRPILNHGQVGQMTGQELLCTLGIEHELNAVREFQNESGRVFSVWRTWSRRFSRSYTHVSTPSGPHDVHMRGPSHARVCDFEEVC